MQLGFLQVELGTVILAVFKPFPYFKTVPASRHKRAHPVPRQSIFIPHFVVPASRLELCPIPYPPMPFIVKASYSEGPIS